jgi:hypothetical protein
MRRVLGVFAKVPRPGAVKSRLAAGIGPDAAARVYDAFLRDFLPRLAPLPFERVLAYAPESAQGYFQLLTGSDFVLEPQSGSDLGERMRAFFDRRFRDGAQHVVLVGSDSPNLPLSRVHDAFASLDRCEIVLGPSDDGGYYLLGARRLVPELFAGITWGTPAVLAETTRRLASIGVVPALLESFYDVDVPRDLTRLAADIAAARRDGHDPHLPHVEAVLNSLDALACQ